VLQRIEAKERAETAHRVRRSLSAVMRYAVLTHRADTGPSAALKGALAPVPNNHFAAITEPNKVAKLLRAIRGYAGGEVTRHALQFAALTFVRPGELRATRWDEFAFDLNDPPKGKNPQHPEPQSRTPRQERCGLMPDDSALTWTRS